MKINWGNAKGLMVYPSEYLDPKTKNYWSLIYVCCTCGLGIPHDIENEGQCSWVSKQNTAGKQVTVLLQGPLTTSAA